MKDFLQDVVSHTYNLGFLPLIKITASKENVVIDSVAEDRSVVLKAKTHDPIDGLDGVFGMPNLNKLDIHLKCPEYKENAKISVIQEKRNEQTLPTGLHFTNETGDFENDYRFMSLEIINAKMKTPEFKGVKWDIEFEPSVAAIQKLRFQANAHSEEKFFQALTKDNNLIFKFGDASTHAGSFIFHSGVTNKLKQQWYWPISQIMSILTLSGDIKIKIADAGAMQITVDSGIAVYDYILPAQSK